MEKILSFIAGTILFVGLILAGWGINNIPDFFSNIYRTVYIVLMTLMNIITVIFVPQQGHNKNKGKNLLKRHKISLMFLQVIPLAIVILAPYCDSHSMATFSDLNFLRIAGLILTVTGFLFMNWAVLILGKQFSVNVTIQEDHQLLTSGPYKYIRHPRYLGILVFFTGISLTFRSWISLVLVILILAVLLWRIHDEEKILKKEFNEKWEIYCKSSWRLLPFFY